MYKIVDNEEIENISDEALVALVKDNPYLYNKKHKDFKNVEMKRDTWNVISTCCGATSREEAENRWNQLRNQLGRKLREAKRKLPSDSGGRMKMISWELMPIMSFLIPHIEHRRTQGSMTSTQNSRISISSSESSSNSKSCLVSPSVSSLDSLCEEISTHDTDSDADDLRDNAEVLTDTSRNDGDKEKQLECGRNTGTFPSKKCKVVPPANAFSQRKQNKADNLELLIAKSSSAIQSMAASLTQNETNKENKMHPFVVAIEAAFQKVPNEMEMECFMAVLNVISKYQ